MRSILGIFLAALLFVLPVFGQTASRADLTDEILSPNQDDLAAADREYLDVFKLLPRGQFDYENNALSIRGGGAYYSFTKKSHSYNDTPQIELQQDDLSVGFNGASYGLMIGLDDCSPVENASRVAALMNYQPRQLEQEARGQYSQLHAGLYFDAQIFRRRLPATVGSSYLLRAISFGEADTLVFFKIHRQDADGGLIIFWKILKEFEKPMLQRDSAGLD